MMDIDVDYSAVPVNGYKNKAFYYMDKLLSKDALLRFYELAAYDGFKKAKYNTALNYNKSKISNGEWHEMDVVGKGDEIYSNMVVSVIPYLHQDSKPNESPAKWWMDKVKALTGKPLGLIVSVVEPFEQNADGVVPVRVFVTDGVIHIEFPQTDFSSDAHPDQFAVIFSIIDKFMEENPDLAVLFNCKAGRSRSVNSIAAGGVQAKYARNRNSSNTNDNDDNNDITPEQITKDIQEFISQVQKYRPQAQVSNGKIKTAVNSIMINMQPNSNLAVKDANWQQFICHSTDNDEAKILKFEKFLTSLELKNAIPQFVSWKEIGGYCSKKASSCRRSQHLRAFASEILHSAGSDDRWYQLYSHQNGDLFKFLNAKVEHSDDDDSFRQTLVANFEQEMKEVCCFALNVSPEQFKTISQQYSSKCKRLEQLTQQLYNEFSNSFSSSSSATTSVRLIESLITADTQEYANKKIPAIGGFWEKTPGRSKHLQNFLTFIRKETKPYWMIAFLSDNYDLPMLSELKKFKDANSAEAQLDKQARDNIISGLKTNARTQLKTLLKCNDNELDKIIYIENNKLKAEHNTNVKTSMYVNVGQMKH